MHQRQDYIPPYLCRQPSARSHLAALGKLAVLDSLPSPAATPFAFDHLPQASSPNILERDVQDGQWEDRGITISQEVATLSSGLLGGGDERDSLPTDKPNTCDSPHDKDFLAPRASISMEGSVANLSLVQHAGLEHGSHPYEPVTDETAQPAEADDIVPDSTSTAIDVARTVEGEQPLIREDVLPSPCPNADSETSTISCTERRKRKSLTPDLQLEKRQKKPTADEVQEELLARAT
jgi:hypothetical protein